MQIIVHKKLTEAKTEAQAKAQECLDAAQDQADAANPQAEAQAQESVEANM